MTKKEIDEILSDSYSWIKVKRFGVEELECTTHEELFMELEHHHIEETEFLINKCKELAKHIKNNNILV